VSGEGTDLVGQLVELLEPRSLEEDLFEVSSGGGQGRLFGGLVAAQSVVAAGRTVSEGALHSLHAYFLRPGRPGPSIRLVVDRIRDGRTFTTRRVVALQSGEAIFNLSASFTRSETGISHHDPMPAAPPPEGLDDWEDVRARVLGDPSLRRPDGPIAIRVCDPDSADPSVRLPPRKRMWMRPRGPLPEDPLLHTAVLVYATDRTMVSTAARPHGLTWGLRSAASLDHAVWIHRTPRLGDWILYVTESPAAHNARGLVLGAMYSSDGARIATVAQEGLIRTPRRR
jgi:acyl-CoA thioesterase-2